VGAGLATATGVEGTGAAAGAFGNTSNKINAFTVTTVTTIAMINAVAAAKTNRRRFVFRSTCRRPFSVFSKYRLASSHFSVPGSTPTKGAPSSVQNAIIGLP
jgi:hypothetical protein